jgi:glycosyltransferase involved in cell wall biosynthesis
MACGVLTVATRVGDTERILQDDNRLVPPGDAVALAGAINAALETLRRADATADAQRVNAERTHLRGLYDVDLCMQAYRETYARLLGGCR